MLDRSSGILLHPTSLPSRFGVGDFGPAAHDWVDWLATTGTRWWQVLPLGPTGYGDSPYQCFSAFALNPFLISPELLVSDGLVSADDTTEAPGGGTAHVDFGAVIPWKRRVLDTAFARFADGKAPHLQEDFERFREEHAAWLDDFSLFMAVKESLGGGSWHDWPSEMRHRDRGTMRAARVDLTEFVSRHVFRQFAAHRQWTALHDKARDLGIGIIGDVPIFVAMDSADVWANPDLFMLDNDLRPISVAGVPPDYFAETGQLWGNPLYDWPAHVASGFEWWIDRIRAINSQVDLIRIDHFRGFVDYWEVPADAPTAETGRWVDGPGEAFFRAIDHDLGGLPIIAEDLGELHETVPALRDLLALPGMKILQFAFDGDPANDFLPSNYPENCVVYTGTHDNQTAAGWLGATDEWSRARALKYLDSDDNRFARDLVAAAWRSRADLAAAPMQDLLGLDDEARMNTPGDPAGNWTWRMEPGAMTPDLSAWLLDLNRSSGRTGG